MLSFGFAKLASAIATMTPAAIVTRDGWESPFSSLVVVY